MHFFMHEKMIKNSLTVSAKENHTMRISIANEKFTLKYPIITLDLNMTKINLNDAI